MKLAALLLFCFQFNTGLSAQTVHCGLKSECICSYSFVGKDVNQFADLVVNGKILAVDTISISEVITTKAMTRIKGDDPEISACAREVLEGEMVIRAEVVVSKVRKGDIPGDTIFLLTPVREASCGFKGFASGRKFLFNSSLNETADDYFLWTIDREDYLELKPEYKFWTNKCQPNLLNRE